MMGKVQKINLLLFILVCIGQQLMAQVKDEELSKKNLELVEAQLKAYNQRNIEAFLLPYSDSVKVFNFPNQLQYHGKTQMRKIYSRMFKDSPDLNCKLVDRIQLGQTIIDQE